MKKIMATLTAILMNLSLGLSFFLIFNMESIQWSTEWTQLQIIIYSASFYLAFGIAFYLYNKYGTNVKERIVCVAIFLLMGIGSGLSVVAIYNQSWLMLVLINFLFIGVASGIGNYVSFKTIVSWYSGRQLNLMITLLLIVYGLSSVLAVLWHNYLFLNSIVVFKNILLCVLQSVIFIVPSIIWLRYNDSYEENNKMNYSNLKGNTDFKTSITLYIVCSIIGFSILVNVFDMSINIFNNIQFYDINLVFIFGITGIIGRIFWPILSNLIGMPLTILVLISFQAVALLELILSTTFFMFVFNICIISSCYGGMMNLLPLYLNNTFKKEHFLCVYSYYNLAWSIVGFIVPIFEMLTYQITFNYYDGLKILLVISLACVLKAVKFTERNIRRTWHRF